MDMGHEIVYVAGCQAQLRGPGFNAGNAFRLDGKSYCGRRAAERRKELPPEKLQAKLKELAVPRDFSGETPWRGVPKALPPLRVKSPASG